MTGLNKLKKDCSFIGGKEKTALQQFEENQKKPEGCFRVISPEAIRNHLQQFEENQKKPEGCF